MGQVEIGGCARPKLGEGECGDRWIALRIRDQTLIGIVDGLGHGAEAAQVARVVVAHVREQVAASAELIDLRGVLRSLHHALRSTRGAVAGFALISPCAHTLHYSGVGNTQAHLVGARDPILISAPGLLGGPRVPPLTIQQVRVDPGALLVLHTDGLVIDAPVACPLHWECGEIARDLVAQWGRPDDDAAVVVARIGEVCLL